MERISKNATRGGLSRTVLEGLVAEDLSIAQIAVRVDRGASTVRHWLRYHGLETTAAARRRQNAGAEDDGVAAIRMCAHHGRTRHVRRLEGGWRCAKCSSASVSEWRRRLKRRLVAEAGGACAACGYERCIAALQFHHLNPATKRFNLSLKGLARSYAEARAEAQKCVLLCANCHAEVEAGVLQLPR